MIAKLFFALVCLSGALAQEDNVTISDEVDVGSIELTDQEDHEEQCFIVASAKNGEYKQVCGNFYVTDVDTTTEPKIVEDVKSEVDVFYIIICGALVFFMQAGFGMLEAGCVTEKNVLNILFKNLMDASCAAIVYWLVGYGFAFGGEDDNGFIGTGNFGLSNEDGSDYHMFFFQWAFSATAATIVAGSVAERCTPEAYFIYSIFLTGFIYPVVVHWIWDNNGWMSAFSDRLLFGESRNGEGGTNNVIDFAGCGVVHMVGGFAGLCGTWIMGPRLYRFQKDSHGNYTKEELYRPHNIVLICLGTLILWFGWYGFNCGSTLGINGYSATAGRVAVNTTLAAASGAIGAAILSKFSHGGYDVSFVCNGILGGLVSITSVCAYCEPWGAFIIGLVGACIYKVSSDALKKLEIDDPLEATPVHGFCGIWGLLCPGIFNSDVRVDAVLGFSNDCYSSGLQLGIQLFAVVVVLVWTIVCSLILFTALKFAGILRVTEEKERAGLDVTEHGGSVYQGSENNSVHNIKAETTELVPKQVTEFPEKAEANTQEAGV